jgi:hypothetical protein
MTGDIEGWVERSPTLARDSGLPDTVSIEVTGPPYPNSGYALDFTGEHVLGQFLVWPNGSIATGIARVTDEEPVHKDAVANDMSDLDTAFREFCRALTEAEGRR